MQEVKDASIITEKDGYTEEDMLFTYSNEEMEENAINRENAKRVFNPKFIPYYPNIARKYKLTVTETLIYGFIDFYTSNGSGRFYFTNEQIAEIIDCSIDTASKSIVKLNKLGLIEVSRTIRAGGGQIRFVKIPKSDLGKSLVETKENVGTNNNKINKNNITISKDIGEPDIESEQEIYSLKEEKEKKEQKERNGYGNGDINTCIEYFQKKLGASLDGSVKENRRYCYNLIRKMKKDYPDIAPVEQVKMLIDLAMQDRFHSKNATSFKYLFYNTQRIAQSFKSDYGVGDKSDIEEIT
jgi:hypothetical protein